MVRRLDNTLLRVKTANPSTLSALSCWMYPTAQITLAQSICTHYSCFENMGRFVTLKKKVQKNRLQKTGCLKTGSLLFKKRRGQAASSLFNSNDPVFWHPAFCNLFFWTFFLKFRTLKNIRSTWYFKIVGADWLGVFLQHLAIPGFPQSDQTVRKLIADTDSLVK